MNGINSKPKPAWELTHCYEFAEVTVPCRAQSELDTFPFDERQRCRTLRHSGIYGDINSNSPPCMGPKPSLRTKLGHSNPSVFINEICKYLWSSHSFNFALSFWFLENFCSSRLPLFSWQLKTTSKKIFVMFYKTFISVGIGRFYRISSPLCWWKLNSPLTFQPLCMGLPPHHSLNPSLPRTPPCWKI